MDPECLDSDFDDVIPISPHSPPIIEIIDSDDDTDLPDHETVKSQRQSNIDKVFSNPSSSSSKPLPATDLKVMEISGVKVLFPVEPYKCQTNVMSKVIRAINKRVNCLVESSTGTGKTFALLCASLAWQLKEKDIIDKSVVENHPLLDPEKQSTPNRTNTTIPTPLFPKQNFGEKCIYDSHIEDMGKKFLNVLQNQPDPSTATTDINYLSNDNLVRLHKKPRIDTSNSGQTKSHPTTPEKNKVPRPTTPEINRNTLLDKSLYDLKKICYVARLPVIFYGARTHKQLEQVVQEYSKTIYSQHATMTILSSRENSCIRDYDSRRWSSKKEMCKSCTKPVSSNNNSTTLCEYYNNRYNLNHEKLPSAFDLNVLKEKGKEHRACPYYAARYMKKDANIVFCPYNFLIDPLIRKSMGINIENDIIIIDEGHNIEDICRQTATFSFTIDQLEAAIQELKYAMSFRFANQDVESFIEHLIKVLTNWSLMLSKSNKLVETSAVNLTNKTAVYDWDVNDFVETLSEHNIGKSHYPDFKKYVRVLSDKIRNNPDTLKQLTTPTVTLLETLDLILGYIFGEYLDSYKPQLEIKYKEINDTSVTAFRERSNWQHYKLHLRCMDPGVVFSALRGARCVVLASGTLAPIDSLESELRTTFPFKVLDGQATFDKQVWVGVLGLTGEGKPLSCNYRGLRERATQLELGRALLSVCRAAPHGVLCFLPSYAVLDNLYTAWRRSEILSQIMSQKRVFRESNVILNHEAVMKEYTEAAKTSGALLLAVYRGKAAEGMDFRDEQARAVVLVGIPYPNSQDEAVRTKMEYNDAQKKKHHDSGTKTFLSGAKWLNVQAFRALNQAMGRCVRHERDWGAVLLLDERYAQPDYSQYISNWALRRVRSPVFDYNSLITHPNGIQAFMAQKEAEDKNGRIQEK